MSISTSELKEHLVESGKTLQTVTRLVKAIEMLEKDRINNVQQIEKLVGNLQKLVPSIPASGQTRQMVETWLSDCVSRLQSDKGEVKRNFGVALENMLKEKGLELKGQYPELKTGFFTIEVDFDKAQANIWYGPKQELMAKARLTPAEVARQLERVEKTLVGRSLNEETFLKRLYESYLRTLSRVGRKEGEHAPILQVLADYVFLEQDKRFYTDPKKEHFKGYGRAFFSYDLYRLHQRKLLGKELSLVVATRASTIRRENFLWVPTDDKGNGTVYAYLYFREVT
jgi:hypothetical protein